MDLDAARVKSAECRAPPALRASVRRIECFCGAVESLRKHTQLLRGAGLIVGVESLIHPWNHNGGVAGVFAGRIDGVLVPGAIGKARGRDEIGLGLAQRMV